MAGDGEPRELRAQRHLLATVATCWLLDQKIRVTDPSLSTPKRDLLALRLSSGRNWKVPGMEGAAKLKREGKPSYHSPRVKLNSWSGKTSPLAMLETCPGLTPGPDRLSAGEDTPSFYKTHFNSPGGILPAPS